MKGQTLADSNDHTAYQHTHRPNVHCETKKDITEYSA